MRISDTSVQPLLAQLRDARDSAKTSGDHAVPSALPHSPPSNDELELITAMTGGDLRSDGTLDLTVGRTAGVHTGVMPGGLTSMSFASQAGSFTVYGAVSSGEAGNGPGQRASGLARGTITGIKVDLNPDASAATRLSLLQAGLSYVHDVNVGDFSSWAEGAILPVRAR